MARLPRLGVAAWPHLVVQGVHDGQSLARDDVDRALLLDTLREASRTHGVSIHAYCLAPDHFHLLLTPEQDSSLSLFMQAVGRRYVSAYNRRHGRSGGLWAGRYRATVLDPTPYLLDAMVWIETHGQRAGGASPLQDDAWSSVRHHLGRCSDPLVNDHASFWSLGNTPFEREAAYRQRFEGRPELPDARLAQLLRAGQLDAVFLQDLVKDKLLSEGGVRALINDQQLLGSRAFASYVLTNRFIERYPNTARRFVEGTARAIEWAQTTPREEVVAKLKQIVANRQRNEEQNNVQFWRSASLSAPGGVIQLQDFATYVDWYQKNGQLQPGQVKADQVFTNRLNPFQSRAQARVER